MDQLDSGQLNFQEDNSRVNRCIRRLSCLISRVASMIFLTGLVSGAPGGLLLGATAVVVLQSLEVLADNRLLTDQLEKSIMDDYYSDRKIKESLQWESDNQLHGIRLSIFAVIFGVFSSTLSLAAGMYVGLSTYSSVKKREREATEGHALGAAGSVCLMGVSLAGYILGLALERFLSINFSVILPLWLLVSIIVPGWMFPTLICFSDSYMFVLVCGIVYTPIVAIMTYMLSFLLEMRVILGAILAPTILAVKVLEKSKSHKVTLVPVPLMLIISDVYYIEGQRIVSLQSPASPSTNSFVLEAIFVGVLASLLWTVTVGMALFESWGKGGAGQICATAAASGAVVLSVVWFALPGMGPGPTIGALSGVAGAAGVSLSAAVSATDHYGQKVDPSGLVGRLGVTVGAAFGAYLSSCTHSGLSGVFMALCAATSPAGALFKLLLHPIPWRFGSCLSVTLIPALVTIYTIVLTPILMMSTNVTGVSHPWPVNVRVPL